MEEERRKEWKEWKEGFEERREGTKKGREKDGEEGIGRKE